MIRVFVSKHKRAVELFVLLHIIFLFIAIRSLHFSRSFNFSTEQAAFSIKAMQLWEDKKIELIGPPISWRYEGRYFFQGSLTYYMIMFFMILGKWDPIISTYVFILLASVMIIPLYYGVKMLINNKTALCMSMLFALFPLFIDYTRFFWNPNFQFSLSPLLILNMGLYKKYKHRRYLFLISFLSGMLLLFHYQFIVVIIGLTAYYLLQKQLRKNLLNVIIFFSGFFVGFAPMIVFELRNKLYNIQTLFLFFQHSDVVFKDKLTTAPVAYYFLCILLFMFLISFYLIRKKINSVFVIWLFVILLFVSLVRYIPNPKGAFGMTKDWNYLYEKKVYEIIRKENLKNYNIVNLGYDTVATVQKYFHLRDKIPGDWDDYYHNKYLFVVTYPQDYMKNPAYEINTFIPSKKIKEWRLNNHYFMYLLERSSTSKVDLRGRP